MADQRLTLADQVITNILGWIASNVIEDLDTEKALLRELEDVLPHVSKHHPRIAPMLPAAAELIAVRLATFDRRGLCGPKLRLAGPMADFFKWRAGLAIEAWRDRQTEESRP
ncbi:hypothetical protein EBL89_03620 [Cereibacter sphaeroides]|uniref:hypothetical protein n=1 Tax=Cereibacter sphaeroides TaxID=1063 RepID=UPI000F53C96B|nr:hypothetical protein [Cereibacter sphaeroides]AZB54454.1 hypothetical protein EBL89_03620 [Cereibacter sphaeroides]AZB58728.1 hypothetical protein EBL88_03710 [Cereibacter sphaeroides]